jgi:3D-(3,5/4)-trihydroxycyclohexane-1,2-dione acylhydrolase (decyclizing)
MKTRRLTMAQALIEFLAQQHVERDGREAPFFAGCLGIFGHGNVGGVGQALQQRPAFRYVQVRNEQAAVHTAAAFAKASNRLRTWACTSSIGPGATNMVTGAACATVNRLPVLLLPGDVFARRNVGPVLQQLESPQGPDVTVNDCFRPVSRYWDRVTRPEQLLTTLPEAMRVLTSPADTGAVTLCLCQDVQAEAWDYPEALFEKRVRHVARPRADLDRLRVAAAWIRESLAPLIIAGGGVLYSEATEALDRFALETGIPVVETQAGKGALHYRHPQALGAMGATGTTGANVLAREADLVIGVGTRYTDFTTASKTAFQNPAVRFVNVNVAELDAAKHNGVALVADAREALRELGEALGGAYRVSEAHAARAAAFAAQWEAEVDRVYGLRHGPPLSQGEVIGTLNELSGPRDVVVCAAGSLPGDLHKLWRTRDPKGYHLEYGYSTMGYEVAGGLGVKLALPDREVYVMVGDGSYLMMAQEIVTAVQEGVKLVLVILDNHGFSSIGGLSRSLGSGGFGTEYRLRGADGQLSGAPLPIDLALNARSLGAHALRATTRDELVAALEEARRQPGVTAVVVETDREQRVAGYESWWDVAVSEVSEIEGVRRARAANDEARKKERDFI